MTIAMDAFTAINRTSTVDPLVFAHTPVGVPRAIFIGAAHGTSTTDHISSVLYGGVALARAATAIDSAGEVGRADAWFLGKNIPTGVQNMTMDFASATTDDIEICIVSFTAAYDCEVISTGTISADQANPQLTLATNGRVCWTCFALMSGQDAVSTPVNLHATAGGTNDRGTWVEEVRIQNAPSATPTAVGFTATSEDVAMAGFNFAEVQPNYRRNPMTTLLAQ